MTLDYEVMVRTMGTPNPSAFKFVANGPFKKEGKATFNSKEEGQALILVSNLFDLSEVIQVHLFENVMTVTFKEESAIEEAIPKVESIIKTRLPVHDANFFLEGEEVKKKSRDHLPEDVREIEEILDRTIRPGLQADGGDLEVISYENNILTISYEGACGTCPSAMFGTLDAIQSILRNEYNPELEVTIY